MRSLVLALLSIGAVPATAAPCTPLKPAAAARTAAEKRTAEQYAKALAAHKLVPVALALHSWRLEGDAHERGDILDHLERGKTYHVVTMGEWRSKCVKPSFEFVGTGTRIFNVVRKPRTKTTVVDVCGCPDDERPCGGGREPDPEEIGYELPPGTTFAGTIEVEYAADDVVMRYPELKRCKQPDPIP